MLRSSALLLTTVVLLAGCGGDGGDSGSTESTDPLVAGVATIDELEATDRTLSWGDVDDAATYRVSVLAPDGRGIWAGSSDEPELELPVHVMVPPKSRFVVAALDDEGHVLAAAQPAAL